MTRNHKNITVEQALLRASWAAVAAYNGIRASDSPDDPDTSIPADQRPLFAACATAWATLAIALQNERDYEDRKVKEIKEQADAEGS